MLFTVQCIVTISHSHSWIQLDHKSLFTNSKEFFRRTSGLEVKMLDFIVPYINYFGSINQYICSRSCVYILPIAGRINIIDILVISSQSICQSLTKFAKLYLCYIWKQWGKINEHIIRNDKSWTPYYMSENNPIIILRVNINSIFNSLFHLPQVVLHWTLYETHCDDPQLLGSKRDQFALRNSQNWNWVSSQSRGLLMKTCLANLYEKCEKMKSARAYKKFRN